MTIPREVLDERLNRTRIHGGEKLNKKLSIAAMRPYP